MKKSTRQLLEKKGYQITDTQEFLRLSDEEMALIDLKIQLMASLKKQRVRAGVTQAQLARQMRTSQSRIAMLENGSSDVTLDLLCKAMFCLGASAKQIGKAIAGKSAA